jgi:1,4-dihydroxy-6-naphthoate synthase
MTHLRLGLSTCPNDTFALHALMTGAIPTEGLDLEFVLADVEELNRALLSGELEATKASFHAMLQCAADVVVLPAGSALGFGVGPLVLAAPGRPTTWPLPADAHVLAPGRWTTATLLFRLLHREPVRLEQTVFSDILPRLERGEADYGVCIHEARFTWRERALSHVLDLGTAWEEHTRVGLPLGGLCARRALGEATLRNLARAVRASIEWGLSHREACLPSMRRHAQEASEAVLWSHVDLYVNATTVDLGPGGRASLAALGRLAAQAGLTAPETALEILGVP